MLLTKICLSIVFILFVLPGRVFTITCTEYEEKLSTHIGLVTRCFSAHGSPVSLCGWCLGLLSDLHAVLSDDSAVSPSGTPCIELLIQSDKATVDLLRFIADIWNRSFCTHCLSKKPEENLSASWFRLHELVDWPRMYTPAEEYGTPTARLGQDEYNLYVYNNDTKEFFLQLNSTLHCFMQHIVNHTASILDVLSFPAVDSLIVNSSSACSTCADGYYNLLDIYNKKLARLNVDHGEFHVTEYMKYTNNRFAVCFDIQYALNRTQWAWSNLIRCRRPETSVIQVSLPLLVCAIALVLFHVLSYKVCKHPVKIFIYQPKRVEPRRSANARNLSTTSLLAHSHSMRVPSYGSVASCTYHPSNSIESNFPNVRNVRDLSEHEQSPVRSIL
ncbi:hypothetical protein P879_06944 [Paragonimus westermani]|uniref:Osteopetrosis-associated transmembrane protein 1 n=1 Tax=Paragonimus westermani TaxID=34504 RepID=A0A8T0DM38_9TREM|nr:hypothetical protein P879_06944 [Paragonimus westermani]